MNLEEPGNNGFGPVRAMELRWQKDIIEQWLQASPVPPDSKALLEEMLASVQRQLDELEI